MHSPSSLPNMVRVPGKDSLSPWRHTNTTLRDVCVRFRAGFSQTSHSGTLRYLPAASSLKPHWNSHILFSHAAVCFQVAIHRNLVFSFCLSQTYLLLTALAMLFLFFLLCTFQKHLPFKPRVPHSYPE